MAKRFIDSNLFRKDFVKSQKVEHKLFYLYYLCECDHYGIWNVEIDVASVRLGVKLDTDELIQLLHNKIIVIDNGTKWFMPEFIKFQYGDLNPKHKLHASIIKELKKRKLMQHLTVKQHLVNTDNSVKDKDKDMDMDMHKDMDKESTKPVRSFRKLRSGEPTPQKTQKTEPKAFKLGKNDQNYTNFMAAYSEFIKQLGQKPRITSADGAALKQVIKYIESLENKKATSLDVWQFILSSWSKLSAWQQSQIQLRQINSQLPNIIQSLRNGNKTNSNQQSATDLSEALRSIIEGGKGI